MPKPYVYLDHAATTPVRGEVLDAMAPFFTQHFGNPSSLYGLGRASRKALTQAKETVISALNLDTNTEIIWTSGATEASNLAIKGVAFGLKSTGKHLVTSRIEHPATLVCCEWLEAQGWQVTYLPVDKDGFISLDDLEAAIRPDTVLVSLIHGNNEIGTVQHLARISQVCQERDVLLHVDAVQTIGKWPLNFQTNSVDLLSCSAHKFYGPKGVGFLAASESAKAILTPWLHGGGQQEGLRAGTENVAGVVGLATALKLAVEELPTWQGKIEPLYTQLTQGIASIAPQAKPNGPSHIGRRLPGIVNFSFSPMEGEALILRFDLEGICVSSGSACHSAQLVGSHVLQAIGCSEEEAKSSIRFSMGRTTTPADIEAVLHTLPRLLEKAGYFRLHPATASMAL